MKKKNVALILSLTMTASILAGCGSKLPDSNKTNNNNETASPTDVSDNSTEYPIKINHAFGETLIESKPDCVVTLGWDNQDTVLALGTVPVGVSAANYIYS